MIQKIKQAQQQEELSIDDLHDFYDYKREKSGAVSIYLDRLRICKTLRRLGYFRYDNADGSMCYVHSANNRIKVVDERQIIDAFEDYIISLPDREVTLYTEDAEIKYTIHSNAILEQLYKSLQTWFSTLERLRPDRPIEILQDEAKRKYFFFNNTAVEVTDKGITNIPYDKLNGCIWENSIHTRDFTFTQNKGEFERFFEHICSEDPERKEAVMTLIGYLMHNYYEYTRAAVLLTDVNKDSVGKPAGRTGKGILGKALGEMLNRTKNDHIYVSINGKKFDNSPEKRGTCYSLADMSTALIHIEDTLSTFDLESMFGDITEGCEMRKLHQDSIVKDVKFMISMNSTMKRFDGATYMGRLYIFELANYYSDTHRPEDEFGHWFFGSAWTDTDWNEFYSFMLRCEKLFFERGVVQPKDVNYIQRSLKESLPDDFYFWFEDKISPYVKSMQNVRFRKQADLFADYARKYPTQDDEKNRRRFTSWCKRYLDRMSIPYKEIRSTVDYLVLYPTSND